MPEDKLREFNEAWDDTAWRVVVLLAVSLAGIGLLSMFRMFWSLFFFGDLR